MNLKVYFHVSSEDDDDDDDDVETSKNKCEARDRTYLKFHFSIAYL